jgi:hypothetical protein
MISERAKFVKSTNLEIDEHIPKDVYANISFCRQYRGL